MNYEQLLGFLTDTLKKCRIGVQVLGSKAENVQQLDGGLRRLIGGEPSALLSTFFAAKHSTVYRLTDSYHCSYIFFELPRNATRKIFVVGPYLSEELSPPKILEMAEEQGLSAATAKVLQDYYSDVPQFRGNSPIFSVIEAFCERVFGKDYKVVDIENTSTETTKVPPQKNATDPEEIILEMQLIEKRYAYENKLMEAVRLGHSHKAEALLAAFSETNFEKRIADPVRNLKNYCIIMNTLLRKAAESGGVHPMHLDSMSSNFARKIEQLSAVEQVGPLMKEIFRSYCRLQKNHSMKDYSPPVQKAIACINADLTANLKLKRLAELQNISPGYLSTVFKRETGHTLTSYVNERRIDEAKQMLKNTHLQIQTVAAHCGMPDVQYFSKIFKKHMGVTPKEYRENKKI